MADGDPTLTSQHEHGRFTFRVQWSEPVEMTFESRVEADSFLSHLRASGRTVVLDDGQCGPCAAHHAARHGCPSCGADLGLRRAPKPGQSLVRPPSVPQPAPDQFAIVREQHRLREVQAQQQRQAEEQWRAHLAHADALLDHGEARERAEARI